MITISHTKKYVVGDVLSVAHGARVKLAPKTEAMLDERRRQLTDFVESRPTAAYGFNRGFGHNVDISVADESSWSALQENLIRSHAAAVGDPSPREVVRAALFLRAISLARGHSGVRSVVVKTIASLLNARITPVVPSHGSVGASGDLAPLSHMALALMGEGEVFVGDDPAPVDAGAALARAGVAPLRLESKEGLALNNGVQFSTAFAVLAYDRMRTLLKTATLTTALATQVMLGADAPLLHEMHLLRRHPGALTVARWIRELMAGSPMRRAHRAHSSDGEIQDPYNIRCSAHILGACRELIEEGRRTFEIEINSVTDNPLILPTEDGVYTRVVSGGHFHGMPIAVRLYGLMQAMGIMARLSNMRCARYVDEKRNKGLGRDMKWPGLSDEEAAISSAMMVPEYVSASLTNSIWGACMPTHLFSLSTDAGQEDHVSMSAGLAVRLWETLPRLAEVLAIELAYASQAAAIRKASESFPSKTTLFPRQKKKVAKEREAYENALRELFAGSGAGTFGAVCDVNLMHRWKEKDRNLSKPCEKAVEAVRQVFPVVTSDRSLSTDLRALADLVGSGKLVEVVEEHVALQD